MACRINSQSDERASMDWRKGQWFVEMEPYKLPQYIEEGIERYLRASRLACAFVDLIRTPGGEYVFLEANPQGQFLFMEDRVGLPLLHVASEYLISACADFVPGPDLQGVNFRRFWTEWENGLKDSLKNHVMTTETVVVPE